MEIKFNIASQHERAQLAAILVSNGYYTKILDKTVVVSIPLSCVKDSDYWDDKMRSFIQSFSKNF